MKELHRAWCNSAPIWNIPQKEGLRHRASVLVSAAFKSDFFCTSNCPEFYSGVVLRRDFQFPRNPGIENVATRLLYSRAWSNLFLPPKSVQALGCSTQGSICLS